MAHEPRYRLRLAVLDAAGLDNDRPLLGAMLETLVLHELRRQASWRPLPIEFFHFRDRDDFEADVVMEQGPAFRRLRSARRWRPRWSMRTTTLNDGPGRVTSKIAKAIGLSSRATRI